MGQETTAFLLRGFEVQQDRRVPGGKGGPRKDNAKEKMGHNIDKNLVVPRSVGLKEEWGKRYKRGETARRK